MATTKPARVLSERGRQRRQRLLDAAWGLFLAQGYEATSINQVVAQAGGSLATAYQLFGNKAGLLREVVLRHVDQLRGEMMTPALLAQPPERMLPQLARALIGHSVDPQLIALRRLLIAQHEQLPQLAGELVAMIEQQFIRPLADYFRRCRREGLLQLAEPRQAALLFIQACGSWQQHGLLLGAPLQPSPRELSRTARHAAELFLRGCAPVPPPRPRRPS